MVQVRRYPTRRRGGRPTLCWAQWLASAVALVGAAGLVFLAADPEGTTTMLRSVVGADERSETLHEAGAEHSGSRRLQLLVSTNETDPKTPTPVVTWPREWMPVRVTIKAGAHVGATDETTAPRVVYSWRHPEFPVTCAVRQNEEIALGAEASLPLFYETQTVRAVACARGERASNETVVRVQVSRYVGVSLAAATLISLVLAGAVVGGIFTWLCLPGGSSFSVPSFLLAIYPTLAVAFTATALFDFLTLGAMIPAFIIIGVLGLFGACNAAASGLFFRSDMSRQRQADYRFRRWANKHQVEHGILGCCASACGVGCVKLIYSRFLRLWTFSPDFKAPPGFAPSDIGAGGVQGEVEAAGGMGAGKGEATVGGAELDASANPKESYHLDSPIPPHADYRLDLFEAAPLPLFHLPLLALAIVLELRLGLVDWASPSCVVGLLAFHGFGVIVFLYLLFRVCTYPSRARFADRRRFRAVIEGRSTLGSRDSDDESDRESEKTAVARQLSRSSKGRKGSSKNRDSLSQRDVDRVDAKELEAHNRRGPGQPRLLFVQADRDARKDMSRAGTQGVDTAMPGVESPRMGKGGRNAVLTEKRMRDEERLRRAEERRVRRARGLPSLEAAMGEAAGGPRAAPEDEDEAAKKARQARERREAARSRKDKAARRWQRAVGTDGYGRVEPQQAEAAEAFNMRLQRKADEAASGTAAKPARRGIGGAVIGMLGGQVRAPEPQPEDDLEVEMVAGDAVTLPGGGVARAPATMRVVAKPAVTVGAGRDRRTIRVGPDSPRALEAAARQKMDFDEAVRSNPFHPLHNAPGEEGRPAGGSKARDATRAGRKDGEALPIPAAGAGRRRSVALPGAGKVRTDGDTAVGVLASTGGVAKSAAARGGSRGGAGAAVGRSVAAQTLALRRLAEQGRSDLVPSAKRRESDEDSFDDDL